MSVIGHSEATCIYCGNLITDDSNVEVLGEQMHAACEQKFRRDWEEVSTEENRRERAIARLNRWHNRLFCRVGYSWDIPTLAVCHPGVYNSYRRLCELARPFR